MHPKEKEVVHTQRDTTLLSFLPSHIEREVWLTFPQAERMKEFLDTRTAGLLGDIQDIQA
jgi:hypothetical protein